MTPTERATLEALAGSVEKCWLDHGWEEPGNECPHDTFQECLDAAMKGLRSLLSSPPPAEPGPRCDSTRVRTSLTAPPLDFGLSPWPLDVVLERLADAADHLRSDHNCDAHGHEGVLYAAQAARLHVKALRAAPPASDERPSEERCFCRAVEMGEVDGFTAAAYLVPDGKGGHVMHSPRRCAPNEILPAAAPAPDEGRPQEKKLTHAASAPQRQSPTRRTDAGCDGADRVAVCLRCTRRFDAHPRAKDANCAGFVDDPAAPCLACGKRYDEHVGVSLACPVEWSPWPFQAPAAYYCENRMCAWRGYDKPRERRCPACGSTVWKDGTAGHKPRPALPRDWDWTNSPAPASEAGGGETEGKP